MSNRTHKYLNAFLLALVAAYGIWYVLGGLTLPLFGDEKYGYGPAVHHQAVQGISLQPKKTPYDFSFGHPQLHTSVIALVSRITGISPTGFHLAQLLVNLVLLITLFIYTKAFWFRYRYVLLTLMLIQPVILTQLYMISPEFLLSILFLFGMWSMHKKNYLVASVFGIAAVWTKETGVFIIGVYGVQIGVLLLKDKLSSKRTALIALWVPLSVALGFLTFMLLQKWQMGYYLSPLNLSKTSTSIDAVWWRFLGSVKFVFIEQNRVWLTLFMVYSLVARKYNENGHLIKLSILALSFCLFSALLSHPLERYLLFAVMVLLIGYMYLFTTKVHKVIGTILCMAIFGLNSLNIDFFKGSDLRDVDISYRKEVLKNQ